MEREALMDAVVKVPDKISGDFLSRIWEDLVRIQGIGSMRAPAFRITYFELLSIVEGVGWL